MKHSNFTINSTDYADQPIKITCEGVDDKKLAHFGGLDLTVKAARSLIAATHHPMSFPEKEGDYSIRDKVVALLLNEVGELIRNTSINHDHLENTSNIDLVKVFLDTLNENPDVTKILKEDNELLRLAEERERAEEDAIWNDMFPKK